jgi:hypothetical protein
VRTYAKDRGNPSSPPPKKAGHSSGRLFRTICESPDYRPFSGPRFDRGAFSSEEEPKLVEFFDKTVAELAK